MTAVTTCAHLWHHYKLYMWGKYSSTLGAQNLRHKKKQEGEEEFCKKKTTNFSLLISHADLELLGWQFVNTEYIITGCWNHNHFFFHIKRCQMFGKVLPVCLHNLHVLIIVSHIWIFACIIHKLFIRNIITTDIRLCQSKALFLSKTSFTKIALLTGS